MKFFWNGICAQAVIGVTATLIHWQIFFVLTATTSLSQAASNFAGFCVAASYSFYMNALYTFESGKSVVAYLVFIGVMACVSYAVGSVADIRGWSAWLTLAVYSSLSLLLGYSVYRFALFRRDVQ